MSSTWRGTCRVSPPSWWRPVFDRGPRARAECSSRKPLPRTESLLVEHLCRDAISNLIGLFNCGLAGQASHRGVPHSRTRPTCLRLPTQPEPFDERPVPLDVGLGYIVEQPAPLPNQQHQAAPAVVVVLVLFEVLGEMRDPLGEDCDLDLRGTRVAIARRVLVNDLLLRCSIDRH